MPIPSPKTVRFLAIMALGICAILLVHTSHRRLEANRSGIERPDESRRIYLPAATSLRLLSLGQEVTLADAYWLRFVQYIGAPENLAAGVPQGLELAELITDLDPFYGYAYQSAGIVLAVVGSLDDSDTILEKGMQNVPGRWQLPFYLAFNQWYGRGDLPRGAALLQRAASLPGAPRFLDLLIARLASVSGQEDAARQHFEEMLRSTEEPAVRAHIEERLADLQIEADLRWLDEEIARERMETGLPPRRLDDRVGRSMVALPVSPTGDVYPYDPLRGRIDLPDRKRLGRPVPSASHPD